MSELKPCPFCGGAMVERHRTAFHPQNDCWLAADGPHGSPLELVDSDYAAWNRRATAGDAVAAERDTRIADGSCQTCHGTRRVHLAGATGPIPCPTCWHVVPDKATLHKMRDDIAAAIRARGPGVVGERLTMGVGDGSGKLFVHGDYDSIKAAQAIVLERDRLREALDAIRKATLVGRVCDDVAWFDSITTLHDYICGVLDDDSAAAVSTEAGNE